jgi:hypothetical protein
MRQTAMHTSPWTPPELRPGVTAAVLISGLVALAIGIGATMLLALLWADSIMVVLAGYVVGSGFHVVAHIIDRHIGGNIYETLGLGLLVVIGLAGMYARARGGRA